MSLTLEEARHRAADLSAVEYDVALDLRDPGSGRFGCRTTVGFTTASGTTFLELTAATDLAVQTYGRDLGLDPAKTLAGAQAQNELIVSDETAQNGLFTISEALQAETIASLGRAGVEVTAEDLFDMSLLQEVYAEDPDLVAYAG